MKQRLPILYPMHIVNSAPFLRRNTGRLNSWLPVSGISLNHPKYISRFVIGTFLSILCGLQVHAVTKTSAGSGNWTSASNWSPSGEPAAGDVVIISSGHTIAINTNTNNVASITINGTLTIGNSNTDRTVTVSGNVTINAGGVFNTTGNGGNSLLIGGNLSNSGTFDMNIGSADAQVTFNGSANQSISGAGSTTDFSTLIVNNSGAAGNNIVEVLSSSFTASSGFLTLTKGI